MLGSELMPKGNDIQIGSGFVTGRKSIKKVFKTTIHNWRESCLVKNKRISFNYIFVFLLVFLLIPIMLSLLNFVRKSLSRT